MWYWYPLWKWWADAYVSMGLTLWPGDGVSIRTGILRQILNNLLWALLSTLVTLGHTGEVSLEMWVAVFYLADSNRADRVTFSSNFSCWTGLIRLGGQWGLWEELETSIAYPRVRVTFCRDWQTMTHEPRVFLNKLTRTQSWSFIYMLPVGVFAQKWQSW